MSNPTPIRTPTLAERMEQVEKSLPRLNEIIQLRTGTVATQFRQALGNVVEVVQAIIKLQGDGFDARVQDEVDAARKARAEAEVVQAKAALAQLIENGTLIKAETVTEDSVVVGVEYDKDGKPLGSGYAQVQFAQFQEEAKKALLGQAVGFKYDGESVVFEITDIYAQNPNPTPKEVAQAEAVAETQPVLAQAEAIVNEAPSAVPAQP